MWQSSQDILRDDWSRWTAIIALFAGRRPGRRQVNPQAYAALRERLIAACRSLAESDSPRRSFYASLEEEVYPWMDLHVLAHTDGEILTKLLQQCREVERELRGTRRRLAWSDGFRLALIIIAGGMLGFLGAWLLVPVGSPAITAVRDAADTVWVTIVYTNSFVKWSVIGMMLVAVSMYGVTRMGWGWR
jgi:hypothetical protein